MNPLPDRTVIIIFFIAGLSSISAIPPDDLRISKTPWKIWEQEERIEELQLNPSHIAVNSFGDVILLDNDSYNLVVVTAQGEIYLSGGWGLEEERFSYPTDLTISSGLDVFLCDQASDRILRYDRKLNFITDIDLSTLQPTTVELPLHIAVNGLGEMIVSVTEAWELYLLNADKKHITRFGGITYGEDRFGEIADIAVNDRLTIAVVDRGNNLLSLLSRFGTVLQTIPLPEENIIGVESWQEGWLIASMKGSLYYLPHGERDFSLIETSLIHIIDLDPLTDFRIIDNQVLAVNGSVVTCRLIIHE